MSGLITIRVPLGDRSYSVLVGHGVRHELSAVLSDVFGAAPRRAVIVTQAGVGVDVVPGLTQAGTQCATLFIDDGESAKQLPTIADLCSRFVEFGLTRNDVVIGVGGGVVTDVAGFAAAVYHRGVAVVHVATTLLAQIDAAIGGKTGVNLPQGKNLVGAFWQPSAVLCDTETLDTLPEREMRSGLGEMAKYHFLGEMGKGHVPGEMGKGHVPGRPDTAQLPLEESVAACVRIKVTAVAADETDSGARALLNYGHTLAHALETSGRFELSHGEAVAVGLHYAALVARRLGRIDDAAVERHLRVLSDYKLDVNLPPAADHDELIALFARDKKATNGTTFVLDGPNGLEVVPSVPEEVLREALAELAGTL